MLVTKMKVMCSENTTRVVVDKTVVSHADILYVNKICTNLIFAVTSPNHNFVIKSKWCKCIHPN